MYLWLTKAQKSLGKFCRVLGSVYGRQCEFWCRSKEAADILVYGSASIAYGIKDNAFAYLLLIFANQCLGVPGYLASTALAIAMIWDAVSDPLLGHWSDKHALSWVEGTRLCMPLY